MFAVYGFFSFLYGLQTWLFLLKIRYFGHSQKLAGKWSPKPTTERPVLPCWLRFALSDAQRNRCFICWKPFYGGFDRDIDHIQPLKFQSQQLSLEKLNRLSNLAVVHPACHRQKTASENQKILPQPTVD